MKFNRFLGIVILVASLLPGPAYASSLRLSPQAATLSKIKVSQKILFSAGDDIYSIGVDGSGLKTITSGRDPDWSPDGQQIVFISSDGYISTINMDGTGITKLPLSKNGANPAWSPDGTMIAYSENGVFAAIRLMSSDGSSVYRPWYEYGNFASWSPDGKRLAFYSSGYKVVSISDLDHSFNNQIAAYSGPVSGLDWSPDGGFLALAVLDPVNLTGPAQIELLNLATSELTPLTPSGFAADHPSWSPNGTQIVFEHSDSAGSSLFTIDRDGNNLTLIPGLPQNARAPDWDQSSVRPVLSLPPGGPDDYGYTFSDTRENGGAVFAWQDISSTGHQPNCYNAFYGGQACDVPVGFNFPYYGQNYSQMVLSTFGFLTFDLGGYYLPAADVFPHPDLPNNEIAFMPYMEDELIYFQNFSNPPRLVVEVTGGSAVAPVAIETILYSDGNILVQYLHLAHLATFKTGIENQDGTDGLKYGRMLKENLAVLYSPPTGTELRPKAQADFARTGQSIIYHFSLVNLVGQPESFHLQVNPGHSWEAILSTDRTGTIPKYGRTTFSLTVNVPDTASPQDSDTVTVQAVGAATGSTSVVTVNTTAISHEIGYALNSPHLVRMDLLTHSPAGFVDLAATGCSNPGTAKISPDGATVWILCGATSQIVVIDRSDDAVLFTINDIQEASDIVFDLDVRYALIGCLHDYQFNILAFDLKDHSSTFINVSGPARYLAAHPFLPLVYVSNESGNEIRVIDTHTLTVVGTIDTGEPTFHLSVSRDGSHLYASGRYDQTNLLDISTGNNQVLRKIDFAPEVIYVGDIIPTQDGSKLIVLSGGSTHGILLLDAQTYTILQRYYGKWPHIPMAGELTHNGEELYLTSGDNIGVLDSITGDLIAQFPPPGLGSEGVTGYIIDIAVCPQYDARPAFAFQRDLRNFNPGDGIDILFTVTNNFPTADIIQLLTSSIDWPVELSQNNTGLLESGQNASFTLHVTVPSGASIHDLRSVVITARSATNPLIEKTVHFDFGNIKSIYLPMVSHP